MKYSGKFVTLYEIFPYFTRGSRIKNRFSIIRSILFSKNCTIEFKNGINYSMELIDYKAILHLLSVEKYAEIFKVDGSRVKISFDGINNFFISLGKLSKEDRLLLALFDHGIRDGAFFIDEKYTTSIKNEKILRIVQSKQSIIETSEGIKFFLDAILPDVIVESFIRRVHDQYSKSLMDKVVIDVGAAVGDTPLYFAAKGATVYAIEMTESNYEKMIRNLKLNSDLSKKIIPIRAAIGKDEIIEYYEDGVDIQIGGASLFNKFGSRAKKTQVEGMTVKTLFDKFNISSVDLLKMDCKGCEAFLNKEDLEIVKRVKIDYIINTKSHKIESVLNLLEELGYEFIIYKHNSFDVNPFKNSGNVLAEKISNN